MFKFIKQYAETIDNAQVYPMISLFIFFLFFVALLWYVIKMDKNNVHELAVLPFDDQENETFNQPS
jgi:cbb3-type cytochrome oxidase subunit 3